VNDACKRKLVSAQEAVSHIDSGSALYIHSNAAAPLTLIDALMKRAPELRDVHIYQIITLGAAPYAMPEYADSFYVHALFIGPNTRVAVNEGRAEYTPVFFSDLSQLFYSRKIPIDVCLLQVSPPDADGNMTLGVSLDLTLAAKKHARLVIAEVNKRMPKTFGKASIHIDEIDFLVEVDHELPELHKENPGKAEEAIGSNVASLVEDGATIQMGIGAIPNAVLKALKDKKDLGVHSEMVTDGIIDLVEKGVVNGKRKTVLPGKIAVSFMMGSRRLYDFIHNNSVFEFHPCEFINDPFVIAQNHKMTAINAALQIDLTGQVCADSLGTSLYSGCGGQVDFVRGASRSSGGKAMICLPSTAKDDTISRISAVINSGGGIVTSRADVHYVVTEYGIADLHGKSLKERVKALIAIAHPKFRAKLEEEAFAHFPWFRSGRQPAVR